MKDSQRKAMFAKKFNKTRSDIIKKYDNGTINIKSQMIVNATGQSKKYGDAVAVKYPKLEKLPFDQDMISGNSDFKYKSKSTDGKLKEMVLFVKKNPNVDSHDIRNRFGTDHLIDYALSKKLIAFDLRDGGFQVPNNNTLQFSRDMPVIIHRGE